MKNQVWKEKIAHGARRLLFFFCPPKCAACGKVGYYGLCPACDEALGEAFAPKRFLAAGGNGHADAMFALFPYRDPTVRTMLFDWKRVRYRDLPHIFSPYVEKAIRQGLLPKDIHRIAYLPRRKLARIRYGFDQAREISFLVSRPLALPTEELLFRRGLRPAQHKVPYKKRRKNVRGVFHTAEEFSGENVLLIDDIITTGATAREGARVLKKAGAMKVYILSLAH